MRSTKRNNFRNFLKVPHDKLSDPGQSSVGQCSMDILLDIFRQIPTNRQTSERDRLLIERTEICRKSNRVNKWKTEALWRSDCENGSDRRSLFDCAEACKTEAFSADAWSLYTTSTHGL